MRSRTCLSFVVLLVSALSFGQLQLDQTAIPFVQAKRRALVIGAGDYQTLGKLEYSASDATKFANSLKKNFRFSPDTVDLVTDENGSKLDGKTILSHLDRLLNDPTIDKSDLFIFYFSGHGVGVPSGDYLCSPDSTVKNIEQTGLKVTDIIERLGAKKLRNFVFIADACRSGEENFFGSQITDIGRRSNLAILLGSKAGQKSYEVPRLKSGVFTHYLLRAMENVKTRTKTGALWFSKVGASLQGSVVDYTTQEFGNAVQTPVVVADPTSDVLMANFAPSSEAAGDDPQVAAVARADQLFQQGEIALDEGDFGTAVDLLKQAYALDSENLFAAYYASVALDALGRQGEKEKFCDFLKNSQNSYFRALGNLQSDSRMTPIADRIKAAEDYWNECPKTATDAMMIWGKMRVYAPMSVTATMVRKMLPSFEDKTRIAAFFRGELAFSENDYPRALAEYDAAILEPDTKDLLPDSIMEVLASPLLRFMGRQDELRSRILKACEGPNVAPLIWVSGAMNLRLCGFRDEAIALAKRFLPKAELNDVEIVQCVQALGTASLDHVEDFKRQLQLTPFSWVKHLVSGIVEGMKIQNLEKTATALEIARKYCDDDMEIVDFSFQIEDAIIDDAITHKGVPYTEFLEVYSVFRSQYFSRAAKLGTDFEKWARLTDLGIKLYRAPQAYRLLQHYNPDFKNETQLDAKFITTLLQLGMTVDDEELAKFGAFHPSLVTPDKDDNALLYYVYLYGKDRTEGLKEKIEALGTVSDTLLAIREALMLALTSTKADYHALSSFASTEHSYTEGIVLSKGIAGLALLKLGAESEAEYCLSLFGSFQSSLIQTFSYRCTSEYIKLLRKQGKPDDADAVTYSATQYSALTPSVRSLGYGGKPDINRYAGQYEATCKWMGDEEFDEKNPEHLDSYVVSALGEGAIKLKVTNDGKVSGTLSITKGPTFAVTGKVDGNGNLDAKAIAGERSYDIESKLVPPYMHKTDVVKGSPAGQAMLLTHSKTKMMVEWFWNTPSIKFTPLK